MKEIKVPEISIILTFHNRHKMVKRAISNIFTQSIKNFELILVDDFSDKPLLAKELETRDIKITYLRNSFNLGANRSRLRGLKVAKGDYICFHDDDDYWMNKKLEKQFNFLKNNSEYYLVSSYAKTNNKILKFPKRPTEISLSIYNCIGSFSIPMIRRCEILFSSLENDLSNAQDWHVWRNIQRLYPTAIIPEVLVFFDDGGHTRISSKKNKKKYYESYLRVALANNNSRLIRYYHQTLSAYHCSENYLMRSMLGFLTLSLRLHVKILLYFEER